MLTAKYNSRGTILCASLVLAFLIAWGVKHTLQIMAGDLLTNNALWLFWIISFLALSWSNIIAFFEKPKKASDEEKEVLNNLRVSVLVPVYNEDPYFLKACIESLVNQTRKPTEIHIVDDGSDKSEYTEVIGYIKSLKTNIRISWTLTENLGKRNAQKVGIMRSSQPDIFLTVDSDTILDPRAIEQGLIPFVDPEVKSVAGVLLALNNDENFLTRFSGTWETSWQLVDRSGQSALNCVTVNSGPLAFYRASIIQKYLKAYMSETFFGKPVKFSDDSLLTTYCLYHGKTVQQPTSICFSAVPNNVNHHLRRFTRWMRGSFIRSWWRFKYLPVKSYVYWLHIFKMFQFFVSSFAFVYLLLVGALTNPSVLPYLILIPVAISYLQSLRYFTISRSDQSSLSRFVNFLLAPISLFWLLTVLRVVKWYGYATCLKTGWGTRQKVEATL